MTTRALATTAIRVYALLLMPRALASAVQAYAYATSWQVSRDSGQMAGAAGAILSVVVLVALVFFLLAFTRVVVGWVVGKEAGAEQDVSVTGTELTALALSIAGVVFLVTGLDDLVGHAAAWYFLPQDPNTHARPYIYPERAQLIGASVTVIAGGLLLIRVKNIVRFIHWLRTA